MVLVSYSLRRPHAVVAEGVDRVAEAAGQERQGDDALRRLEEGLVPGRNRRPPAAAWTAGAAWAAWTSASAGADSTFAAAAAASGPGAGEAANAGGATSVDPTTSARAPARSRACFK